MNLVEYKLKVPGELLIFLEKSDKRIEMHINNTQKIGQM